MFWKLSDEFEESNFPKQSHPFYTKLYLYVCVSTHFILLLNRSVALKVKTDKFVD